MISFELSNEEIVLYALHLLGGWHKRVHTEDIALKCFELAPSKFSWTKYPKYPDLAPARFALESAKNSQYGSLVEGESERKKNHQNDYQNNFDIDRCKYEYTNYELYFKRPCQCR